MENRRARARPRFRPNDYFVIFVFIVIAILLVVFLSPIFWMVTTAFKDKGEYFTYPPIYFPKKLDFSHFLRGLQLGGAKGIKDTLIVAASTTALSMIIGSLAAYSLARFRIGGKHFAFWILSIRMMPPVASVLPLFLFYRFLKILDTYEALIITYTIFNLPFAV
jgi:multiple sugar transport system permease protein